jgi:hypothetical protein
MSPLNVLPTVSLLPLQAPSQAVSWDHTADRERDSVVLSLSSSCHCCYHPSRRKIKINFESKREGVVANGEYLIEAG